MRKACGGEEIGEDIFIDSEGYNPCVIFDNENYFVVFEKKGDIYGVKISPEGEALTGSLIPISTLPQDEKNPWVIFDGKYYFVVWELRDNKGSDIYGAILDKEGKKIKNLVVTDSPGDQKKPCICRGYDDKIMVIYEGPLPSNTSYQRIWGKSFTPLGVEEREKPNKFYLSSTFLKEKILIFISLPSYEKIRVRIYDSRGNFVKEIYNGISKDLRISWKADKKFHPECIL